MVVNLGPRKRKCVGGSKRAHVQNQERVLAIYLKREAFHDILRAAVHTSMQVTSFCRKKFCCLVLQFFKEVIVRFIATELTCSCSMCGCGFFCCVCVHVVPV